ncbi:MAG: hypothetical protein KC502_17720 [Myxococcales bacterium]|nr:hypothetical protein [Myxococcales bacterium]
MLSRKCPFPRRTGRQLLGGALFCASIAMTMTGCYHRTQFQPSHGVFKATGQARAVAWGSTRHVALRPQPHGPAFVAIKGQKCRKFTPGNVRLVDKGYAGKKRLKGAAITLGTLSFTLGGGILAAGLTSDDEDSPATAIGLAMLGVPALAMLIRAMLPAQRRSQRSRTVRGGRWHRALRPCGRPVRIASPFTVTATAEGQRTSVRWSARRGAVVIGAAKRDALRKWSSECRARAFGLVAKMRMRQSRRSRHELGQVLGRRDRRNRRYRLASKGIEVGRSVGQGVRAILRVRGLKHRLVVDPKKGQHLPIPGGTIGRFVQRCVAARAQRIARHKKRQTVACQSRFTSEFLRRCQDDCRDAGDAMFCTWEREDCELLAAGTGVNCHSVYNKCMDREGLSATRIAQCSQACVAKISQKSCTRAGQIAERNARAKEALR